MLRLLIALTTFHLVSSSCPPNFTLVARGECRGPGVGGRLTARYDEGLQAIASICRSFAPSATPVIIHNAEQNSYWAAHSPSFPYEAIGVWCNPQYNRYYWIDGSAMDYNAVSGPCTGDCTWYTQPNARWSKGCYGGTNTFDVSCIMQLPKQSAAFDNCQAFNGVQKCYQSSISYGTFYDAQKMCKSLGGNVASVHSDQENNFIRRMAVANGQTNGLILGALRSSVNPFQWLDGTTFDYVNYEPGFPLADSGDCLVMVTNDVNGRWVNNDCNTPLPFVCEKDPYAGLQCPGGNVAEGDVIVSPGFPTSAYTPCDFFLTVAPGKIVEVEIILLEANTCCDHLTLYEGSFGGTIITTLTGELSNVKYRTSSSNTMRVSWQPSDGVNVRGVMMSYRAV